jgi:hypothetical protein
MMTDKLNRLTKSKGLTMADVYRISKQYYKSAKGDDKKRRMRLDIKSAKVVRRVNYEYDPGSKEFVQTGRNVRLEFIVSSVPVSYKKTDNISIHKYPVTFLISDISKGIYSTFKWRTGGLKKPIFKNPSMSAQQIGEKNIRNGCQMQFVYELMWALKIHSLLYGRSYVTRPAKVTNPRNIPFLDKHALFIFEKVLVPLLGKNGGILAGTIIKGKK